LYISLGKDSEYPDKLFMQLFASRIVAFLHKDEDLLYNNSEVLLKYSFSPEAILYLEYYTEIFKMVIAVLMDYAGKDANAKETLEMSRKLDEYLKL
jgi:hypothetical protein